MGIGDELRNLRPRFGGFREEGGRERERGVTVGRVQTDPWMAEMGTRYSGESPGGGSRVESQVRVGWPGRTAGGGGCQGGAL